MADYLKDLPDDFNPGPLDLDQPLDNQVALLKLQADLSGADVQGGFVLVTPGTRSILNLPAGRKFKVWNDLLRSFPSLRFLYGCITYF